MMMPVIEELEIFYGKEIEVIRMDIEKESEIAVDYGIQTVPTFVIMREGTEVGRMAGIIDGKIFRQRIDSMLNMEERQKNEQ